MLKIKVRLKLEQKKLKHCVEEIILTKISSKINISKFRKVQHFTNGAPARI